MLRKPKKIKGKKPSYEVTDFRDRLLTNMNLYFRSVDWAAMWEDWYLGVNEDGSKKYRHLRDFIEAKSESKDQTRFLYWYLGPNDKEAEVECAKHHYEKSGADGPVDYVHKRKTGGWFSDQNMRALSSEITRRMTALEALREAGNRVTLHSLLRAGQLASQLDQAFQGQFFLPGLSMKANAERAELYIRLHERLQMMIGQAQDLYAKSHGVNFADMAGLAKLMEAAAMAATQQEAVSGKAPTREQAVLKSFAEMTLVKAHRYNMPIPPDAESKIVDSIVESDEIVAKKKKFN